MNPSESTPLPPNEGELIVITFAILFGLSVWTPTAKLAMFVAIAITALVWANAVSSGQAKSFWNALGQ